MKTSPMHRLLFQSVVSFVKNHNQMLSASISCYFMLSFIPLVIFLVSVMGLVFAGNESFQIFLVESISDLFPEITADIREELFKIIENAEVGLINLIGYLFFSYHLYVSLDISVNAIFNIHGTRPVPISVANSLLFVTLLMGVVIFAFGTTSVVSLLVHVGTWIGLPRSEFLAGIATGFVLPLFLVFSATTAFYRFLPRTRISWASAMKGAVFTAIFLEAAKYLFTFYIAAKLAHFGPFYGSLTGVVVFIIWLVYSASIFLIGAGFVRNLEIARKG